MIFYSRVTLVSLIRLENFLIPKSPYWFCLFPSGAVSSYTGKQRITLDWAAAMKVNVNYS